MGKRVDSEHNCQAGDVVCQVVPHQYGGDKEGRIVGEPEQASRDEITSQRVEYQPNPRDTVKPGFGATEKGTQADPGQQQQQGMQSERTHAGLQFKWPCPPTTTASWS